MNAAPNAVKSLVAIDGIDGSGKSTFARRLATSLAEHGCRSVVISIDDFRRPVAWNALTEPEVDAYYGRYYDLGLAETTLRTFLAGEPGVTIPRYDSVSESIAGTLSLPFAEAEVAIVEGVFPLRVPAVAQGLCIFLDVSPAESRRRIITRDLQKKRTREEIERRIDRRYFPAQERYHATLAPRERADVIIANDNPREPEVRKRELSRAPERLRGLLDRVLVR